MRRLIRLKLEHGKKVAGSLTQFRADIKQWNYIKILKEYSSRPEVIIEYPDAKHQEAYDNLRKLDIVEIIDSILPSDFS